MSFASIPRAFRAAIMAVIFCASICEAAPRCRRVGGNAERHRGHIWRGLHRPFRREVECGGVEERAGEGRRLCLDRGCGGEEDGDRCGSEEQVGGAVHGRTPLSHPRLPSLV